jgi:hypothetical protein
MRGFQQDVLWFKARWRSEKRRGPFGRKQPGAAPAAKLHCAAAFSEQSAKAIFRKTLIQANWPVT